MCKLNPVREAKFTLEFYTSNRKMTDERWMELVYNKILEIEQELNKSGEIRVHINEDLIGTGRV